MRARKIKISFQAKKKKERNIFPYAQPKQIIKFYQTPSQVLLAENKQKSQKNTMILKDKQYDHYTVFKIV